MPSIRLIPRFSFSLFLMCFLLPVLAAQSPWARSKAGFYGQAGFHFIPKYTVLFGKNNEDIELIREVSEQTAQWYAEYGLTDRNTLVLSLPVRFVHRGGRNPNSNLMFAREDTGSVSGLGNVSIAVRHQFLTGKVALGGTLRLDFPSDHSRLSAGLRTGFNAFTVQPSISVGMSNAHGYWFGYGGFVFRTNQYSHVVNSGGEAGLRIGPVWIIGFSDLLLSVGNGARKLTPLDALTGLYDNDQGWLSVGIKGIWQLNRFVGIVVSGAGAVWAQYVPESPGIGMAVFFKWE